MQWVIIKIFYGIISFIPKAIRWIPQVHFKMTLISLQNTQLFFLQVLHFLQYISELQKCSVWPAQCSKTFWISCQHLITRFHIKSRFLASLDESQDLATLSIYSHEESWSCLFKCPFQLTPSTIQPISLIYIILSPADICVFTLYTRVCKIEVFLWSGRRGKQKMSFSWRNFARAWSLEWWSQLSWS